MKGSEIDIHDVYSRVNEVLHALKAERNDKLSGMLEYRMRSVAWSSGFELLDELSLFFQKAIDDKNNGLSDHLVQMMTETVGLIDIFIQKHGGA